MCDDELIEYVNYTDESMLPDIQRLVSKDLSEPYSVYTYRYFLHQWPKLSICVFSLNPETKQRENMIATIVCRGKEQEDVEQGYIAMLAVDQSFRNKGIGSKLVNLGIQRMIEHGCKEIVLETEVIFFFSPFYQ